jgi:hypothetical protein
MGEDSDWESQDTAMLLTLNNLAKTYKMLPSEALARATTFDLYILDVAARYEQYSRLVMEGKMQKKDNKGYSQEQLLAMVDRVKNQER